MIWIQINSKKYVYKIFQNVTEIKHRNSWLCHVYLWLFKIMNLAQMFFTETTVIFDFEI